LHGILGFRRWSEHPIRYPHEQAAVLLEFIASHPAIVALSPAGRKVQQLPTSTR
jgi:hypothetical protein